MKGRPNEIGAGDLVDRAGRETLGAMLACVCAVSVHLAFVGGIVRASVVFVIATALVVGVGRFFGARDVADRVGLPRRSARMVFVGGLLSLGFGLFGMAVLDSGASLPLSTWRSVALAIGVYSSFAALVVFQRTRLSSDHLDSEHRIDRSSLGLACAEEWASSLVNQIRIVVAGSVFAIACLFADGVVQALEQSWGPVRIAAAAILSGSACLWLTALLAAGVASELKRAIAGFRADATGAESRADGRLEEGISALATHLRRGEELIQTLSTERDQQSVEHAHADRLVRGLGLQSETAVQVMDELLARLETSRRTTGSAVQGGEAFDSHVRELEAVAETSAQWLQSLEQRDRGVSASVERISAATRETSAGLAELARAVRGVEPASESITEFSRDVLARAEVGRAKFAETVAGMEAIRTATQTAESAIRGLGARTQEIGGILDVIDDVGDQTSLLALNAAIIAAQAGEQGRAFSVVADEIRDLADRVLVSTKEISGLIRAVQSESERATRAIEAGSGSVSKGVELSTEAGRALDEIAAVARESDPRFETTVVSMRSQATLLQRVVELAGRVEGAVAELVATSEARDGDRDGAVRVVRSLRGTAQELRAAICEHKARLTNVDGDLGATSENARSLGSLLGDQAQTGLDLGRVIEVGGERLHVLRAVDQELALEQRGIRVQADALRTASRRAVVQATCPGPMARTTGERS